MKRKLTQDEINKIMARYLPHRWRYRVHHMHDRWGNADFVKRVINTSVHVEDLFFLDIYLHECGHAVLHSPQGMRNIEKPAHIEEYEAECYAFDRFRKEGIIIPRAVWRRAKSNVYGRIIEDEIKGIDIYPHIKAWASA